MTLQEELERLGLAEKSAKTYLARAMLEYVSGTVIVKSPESANGLC